MAGQQYVSGRGLAVSTFLALRLQRPLFLEGEPGVGKTEVAKVLAAVLDTELIRLQCYEGLDVSHAVYEWNYPRQILEIRLLEGAHALDRAERRAGVVHRSVPDQASAAARHRADALAAAGAADRRDRSGRRGVREVICSSCSRSFRSRSPSSGTIRAAEPPVVVITSNRTREIHDALKRRCVYCWIDYPDAATERRIVAAKVPGVSATACRAGHRVRPGAAQRGSLQDRRRLGNARLGRGARRAQPRPARSVNRRGDARHPPQEPGRHPVGSRRARLQAMLNRALARSAGPS